MKSLVDAFDSTAGWNGSVPGVSAYSENEHAEYIAGLNSKSLVFKFSAGSNGESVYKTKGFDLTEYTELVFHVWSRVKKWSGVKYRSASEYAYKISFGDGSGKEFFVPTYKTFGDVTLDVSAIGSCTEIRITALHDSEDFLIISNMVAVKDELPLDIFQAVKETLTYDLAQMYSRFPAGVQGSGILVGTVSASAGDSKMVTSLQLSYLERYAVIMISDGINSEVHQIDKDDSNERTFFSVYDGTEFVNTFVNANVYVVVPVEFGLSEKDIILPGISVWGMNPEEIQEAQTKLDSVRDTFTQDESVAVRTFDTPFRYVVMIDCEARQNDLIAFMSEAVRFFLAREVLWVNGKKIEIRPEGASTYVEPVEGYNQIPKIQYAFQVDLREEVLDRSRLVKTTVNNRIFIPSRN